MKCEEPLTDIQKKWQHHEEFKMAICPVSNKKHCLHEKGGLFSQHRKECCHCHSFTFAMGIQTD